MRPSCFFDGLDDYTAYCFDEACMYILQEIRDKKTPRFKDDIKQCNAEAVEKLEKMGAVIK